MSYRQQNPNPQGKNVGDCTVRAIALATNKSWVEVYLSLCIYGLVIGDMPSANDTWMKYLTDTGWQFHRLQDTCPFYYTIADFAKDHSRGTYIVGTGTHVVCVKNGDWLDAWDSADKVPMFFFYKE